MTKTLFAIFDDDMYTIDPSTGQITLKGKLSGTTGFELVPSLTSYFDSNTGIYYVAVDDDTHGTHNLLTYFTRNNTMYMTPQLTDNDPDGGDGILWTLYGIAFNPKMGKNGQLLALCQHDPFYRGYPSLKIIDVIKGNATDVIPEYIWGDYDGDYGLWELSPSTNNPLTWLDLNWNIFWMTVEWLDPETLAFEDAVVYYNLTKGGIELGSGPMVFYTNAIYLTNYVWFEKPQSFESMY